MSTQLDNIYLYTDTVSTMFGSGERRFVLYAGSQVNRATRVGRDPQMGFDSSSVLD